jgi:dephospho-CoA kinase
VGITGRSGCGKSTVTALFVEHGVPYVDADQISREILQPNSPILPILAQHFGADILDTETSRLNRRLLADRAFATPEGTAQLNAITHPAIIGRIHEAKQAAQEAGHSLFLIDGAVIVGTACEAECDRLLVVTAPFATSVARISKRDGISEEMAARRLNAQTPVEELCAHANYVLCNDQTPQELRTAAEKLYRQLAAEAANA